MPVRKPIVRGTAAWTELISSLGPSDGNWGSPDELKGLAPRRAYATQRAVIQFLAELRRRGSRRVYLQDGSSLPLSRARFRELGDEPDINGQEGLFGFNSASVSLYGLRGRMSSSGVLELADREGDSVRFGTSSDAGFTETVWEADQWDLPAPVPTIAISADAIERFRPRAVAISRSVLDTRRTDRAVAEAAIKEHHRACRPYSAVPEIRWCESPVAAIKALSESSTLRSTKSDLQERSLGHFNNEVSARLSGTANALHDALGHLTRKALGYNALEDMLRWIASQRVQAGFGYMGLVRSYGDLAWYEFLRASRLDIHGAASSFCAMIAEVWLLFPTTQIILAVERPVSVESGAEQCEMVFEDGFKLKWSTMTNK